METAEKIIQWRRELHRHPEEGWTEFWTTGFVARQLADMGLAPRVGQEVIDPAARMGLPAPEVEARARQRALAEGLEPYWLERMGRTTGLVADVGPADAPLALVLRCDMDALPLMEAQEASHRPVREGFVSRHEGLCHACAHDGHMALGLGLAALLTAPGAAPLRRRVRLLFQPAEEGVRGAASMVSHVAGARHFLAVHIGLGAPHSGDLVTGVGAFLATSKFDVRFTGRAAMRALPPNRDGTPSRARRRPCWACTPCRVMATAPVASAWDVWKAAAAAIPCLPRPSWPARRAATTARSTTTCCGVPGTSSRARPPCTGWNGGSMWWAVRLRRRAMRPSRSCWPAVPGNCRPMPGAGLLPAAPDP